MFNQTRLARYASLLSVKIWHGPICIAISADLLQIYPWSKFEDYSPCYLQTVLNAVGENIAYMHKGPHTYKHVDKENHIIPQII